MRGRALAIVLATAVAGVVSLTQAALPALAAPSRRGGRSTAPKRPAVNTPVRSERVALPRAVADDEADAAEFEGLDEIDDIVETDGSALTDEQVLQLRQQRFQEHIVNAQLAEKQQRHEDAVKEYSAALQLQPGDPAALLARAVARHASMGGRCARRAIGDLLMLETYDPRGLWLDQRATLIDWMGACDVDYASERLARARELASEAPGSRGRPDDIRVTLAKLEYERARRATEGEAAARVAAAIRELERFRKEARARNVRPSPEALNLLGDLYRESDRLEAAIEAYQALVRLIPGSREAKHANAVIAELKDEVMLSELEKTQGGKPTKEAEAAFNLGVAALREGQLGRAETLLSRAIESSPWFPKAYYVRGLVHARTGRFAKAVEDLKRAVRMDRSDYQAHVTLGMIYKKEFAGAHDGDAREHLEIALRARPDLHRLHLLLGELYARTDRELAREHYERFLRVVALDDPEAKAARQALAELNRELDEDEVPIVSPPPEASLRLLNPEVQRLINEAYLRGTEHQDWERAEKILRIGQERWPKEPAVLNELAKVLFAQGKPGDARQFWEQSLAVKEDQMEVHERLGLLLSADLPSEALPHLRRAADLGSLLARYTLASLLWAQTEPFDASEQLNRYLAEAGPYELNWERAQELRKTMDVRALELGLAGGALLLVLIAWPSYRLYRRVRGASLAQLLERAPKSFPEVARILSLIRHEILKHNTAFLADVGRALELETADADSRAMFLARRMFAEGPVRRMGARVPKSIDRAPEAAGGVYGRFLGYLDELERVARSHGMRLNLHRKDPIFRPMIEAFESVAARADELRKPDALRASKRLELARVLLRAGRVLGRQAFERLSGLIQSLCVVEVDAGFVHGVYDQVVGEEQFENRVIAPLVVAGSGARVRIFRTDLEDILANVIRNSLRSSMQYARPAVGLGIDLVTETDAITGLGTLAIRIKDRSPEQLSNEMLRGRYVERGMGITVDLLSRYDGAIGVEAEPGWSKAVVLRFFTLENVEEEVRFAEVGT